MACVTRSEADPAGCLVLELSQVVDAGPAFPTAGLIRSLSTAGVRCDPSQPCRRNRPSRRQPFNDSEVTDVGHMRGCVIGVDTHKHTHTAAVVAAGTGAVLETITIATDVDGYETVFEVADALCGPTGRAWSIEGTGSYGAGLCSFLQARASSCSSSIGPVVRLAVTAPKTTHSTRSARLGSCSPGIVVPSLAPAGTATRCGSCS